jgi:AcrR family transcriptional regulator
MRSRPRVHDGSSEAERQILTATERLLDIIPLTELSVARILKEANVSRTTFYFYFSSKHGPVAALLKSIMNQIFQHASFVADRSGTGAGEQALDAGLAGAAQLFCEHGNLLRSVVEHWRSVPELGSIWIEVMNRIAGAFAEQIDRERAAGLAPPGTPSLPLAASLIWASERILYVAGLGVITGLPTEEDAIASIQSIWKGAIYGQKMPVSD